MKDHELKDFEVEAAELNSDAELNNVLRNFRTSVHAWSDAEFKRSRMTAASQSFFWRWLAAPVVTWGAAAALALTAVGVPVAVHHEHQVQLAARQRAEEQQQIREAQEKAQEKAATQMAILEDDKLLQHVDEDITQSAPDAMEPLASLMSTSGQE